MLNISSGGGDNLLRQKGAVVIGRSSEESNVMAFQQFIWSVNNFFYRVIDEMPNILRTPRTTWTEEWLTQKNKSVYETLIREFRLNNHTRFKEFFRLSPAEFEEVLRLVGPRLVRRELTRRPVLPEERLAVTLRYLATGESRRSLAFAFRISHQTICAIIAETTTLISEEMMQGQVTMPSDLQGWKNISKGFLDKWHYPQCLGAIDGKRVLLQKPDNAGSLYFDYKGHNSIILLAVVDADCKFIYIHVGTPGRSNDAGVWDRSDLRHQLEAGALGIPPPEPLPSSEVVMPYHFVGDDAFPLKDYLLKPYPGSNLSQERAIFNYRLSRGRNTSEDAFGILSARFRVFGKPIHTHPANAVNIVKVSACLHNFLCSKGSVPQDRAQRAASNDTSCLMPLPRHRGRQPATPKAMRDALMHYFMTTGKVSWQNEYYLMH